MEMGRATSVSYTHLLELQNTLAALLANMQKLSEENKANKEEAAKQNKQLLESTEKRIGEKVEIIRSNIETALAYTFFCCLLYTSRCV